MGCQAKEASARLDCSVTNTTPSVVTSTVVIFGIGYEAAPEIEAGGGGERVAEMAGISGAGGGGDGDGGNGGKIS